MIGSEALTKPVKIGANGIWLDNLTALLDTGAGLISTVSPEATEELKKKCGIQVVQLATPILVKGFTKKIGQKVTHGFIVVMRIDSFNIRIPFLVCKTGRHDVFIRRKFFEL